MDFTLSPEQQGVQKKAQSLAREVLELSARLDREARFPREILQRWAQGGMFGLALPREYGGQGLDYVSYVLAQMELAQVCPASALILHVNHSLFGGAVAQFGTPAQKEAWLPPVARSRYRGAVVGRSRTGYPGRPPQNRRDAPGGTAKLAQAVEKPATWPDLGRSPWGFHPASEFARLLRRATPESKGDVSWHESRGMGERVYRNQPPTLKDS